MPLAATAPFPAARTSPTPRQPSPHSTAVTHPHTHPHHKILTCRSYTPWGKTGAELLEVARRVEGSRGLSGDLLMRHGDFSQPRPQHFETINQLTMGPDRHHGEPRVAAYVWTPR